MAVIAVPKILRDKLGEEGTDALVELINAADSQTKVDVLTFVEEKFERRLSEEVGKLNERLTTVEQRFERRLSEEAGKLSERLTTVEQRFERRLSEEVGKLNERLTTVEQRFERRLSEEVGKLNERLTSELGKVSIEFAKVRQEMAELKADLLRWMFIFWVGQIGALLGILFAFFRR